MRIFFFLVSLFSFFFAHSQDNEEFAVPDELKDPLETTIDNPQGTYSPKTSPSLTNPEYRNKFNNMVGDVDSYFKKEEKPLNLTTDNGLMKRTVKIEPGYLQKGKDAGFGNTEPQFLGKYIVDAKFVEIYCRDHEFVDGDRVKVYVNGNVVERRITLHGDYQPILVTLEKGTNRIEFEALNEGTSSPNTAEFIVYDDMGNVVAHNQWNLATGVKASFVVIKK